MYSFLQYQIKFAAARHNGATKTKAASLAGYSGNAEAMRSAGVRASTTKAVDDLLTLAAAAEGGHKVGPLSDKDIEAKLDKLVSSPDPLISLKAMELREKFHEKRRQANAAMNDDGWSEWRVERDMLLMKNGASIYVLLLHANHGCVANCLLLHDTYYTLMREEGGPELWARLSDQFSAETQQALEANLADPSYQLEARKRFWGEINQQPPAPFDPTLVDWRVQNTRHALDGNNAN